MDELERIRQRAEKIKNEVNQADREIDNYENRQDLDDEEDDKGIPGLTI